MDMKTGQMLFGFEVTRVQPMPAEGAVFYELRHSSGARLAWMQNGGENKLFSIAFKTIPSDDTGVFHILEHTVLNGSQKYPVKEPFAELMKSSMQTFLNAMTFPDKTVFPVSSRNDADFLNLVKVYLDGVFAPAIYDNPCIFQQEGWHYELRTPGEDPVYKGVVFNEMKGAMSSVFAVSERELNRMLFPDNCYRFVSGGDPEYIPELTYEAYLDFHHRCYTPSNAYIYLDGPVDAGAALKLLDEYLSGGTETAECFDIPMQKPITPVEAVCHYEVSPGEPLEQRAYLSFGKVIASWQERERQYAAYVLCEAMAGSNAAPLKRTLLDTGLCQDVSMYITDGIQQPYMTLCIQNTEDEYREKLRAVLRETVWEQVKDGIDRASLAAAIDHLELQLREGSEPRGLERNLRALSAWLYGGDPLLYLDFDGLFAYLREKLDSDYYEQLLSEMLLEEEGLAVLRLLPSPTLGEARRAAEEDRLHARKVSWTSEQLQQILEENIRLDAWQQSTDTPEQLATLPRLALSEVSRTPEQIITRAFLQDGVRVLFHPAIGRGVVGLNLYFSLGGCTEEELTRLAVMTNLLGQLPTRRHSAAALQQKLQALFGTFWTSIDVFSDCAECCVAYFAVKTSFLEQQLPEALALLAEILTDTDFGQPELIRQILLQCRDGFRQGLIEEGHRFAMGRVLAHHSAEGAVRELSVGFEAYERLKVFLNHFDAMHGDWIRSWQALCGRLFCQSRLTVGMTAPEALPLTALTTALSRGEGGPERLTCRFCGDDGREEILIPSGVAYAAAGVHLPGQTLDVAAMQVVSAILSFDYLWNEIRVKGGAYGASMRIGRNGDLVFYSYRDPSPLDSLAVFRHAAGFLRDFCGREDTLEHWIISTLARQEPLRTGCERGILADELFFRGVTDEVRRSERRRMLSLRPEDLLPACALLESIAEGAACVIGGEDALNACEQEKLTIRML